MRKAAAEYYDVVIVGGGLVGASLALALAPSGMRIAVVEAQASDSAEHLSYDARTVALTDSSCQILATLGLWDLLPRQSATPILDLHVSKRGQAGSVLLSHRDIGRRALGYVVPTRAIGAAVRTKSESFDRLEWLCPATAQDYHCGAQQVSLNLVAGTMPRTLHSQLLVVADGGRANLLAHQPLKRSVQPYAQAALVCVVKCSAPNRGRAYERFLSEGVLALLPHTAHAYAVVWSMPTEQLKAHIGLSKAAFVAALQRTFGHRAGDFAAPSQRICYPLQRAWLESPVQPRLAVVGNAAHTLHPVAGQGFNLGLRAVAELAEMLVAEYAAGRDVGDYAGLQRYARARQHDTCKTRHFTHGLLKLFGNDRAPLKPLRSVGLMLLEMLPPLKRQLLKHSMGLAGRQSKLARGLPLA